MEITQRLYTSMANQEVTAVLLNDEGEEYPVFLESLHNTFLFPLLLESGYKLESLPYGFVKDGIRFDKIPKSFYNLTPEVEERMYNSLGVKLSTEELKQHLSQEEVPTLETPDTNYTIFTREDFLEYLENISKYQLDDDYMPLNYFVAPAARFTAEEFTDPRYAKYINIINDRRKMSLTRFDRLIEFLHQYTLPVNYKAIDVIDAYFAWGVDGMNFDVINKRRSTQPFRLLANPEVSAQTPMIDRSYGLVDSMGNILIPHNQKNVNWKLANKDPNFASDIASRLPSGASEVVELTAPTTQDVVTLESRTVGVTVMFSTESWVYLRRAYPTIRIESPERSGVYTTIEMALPSNRERMKDHYALMALARRIHEIRKPKINVSSYKALTVAGCNPRAAIQYIVTTSQMYKEIEIKTSQDSKGSFEDEELPKLTANDIEDYLSGALEDNSNYDDAKANVRDNVRIFLDSVVGGDVNIDLIKEAKEEESRADMSFIYSQLFAVHNVLGISLKDIYDQLHSIGEKTTTIRFSSGNIFYDVDVSPMRLSYNAYNRDLESYDFKAAKDCTFFTYVLRVAREVGCDTCRRHVGVEFMMVNKTNRKVKEVLQWLEHAYNERVGNKIGNSKERLRWDKLIDMFCLSRYFEIAFKGTITWPAQLGGDQQPALPSHIEVAKRSLEHRIENTVAYCDFTVNMQNMSTMTFLGYCTNAYITPEYVIPRSNDATIREIPFFTAWFDYRTNANPTFQALVNNGTIPADFVSWDGLYFSDQFVRRGLNEASDIDSLTYYYEKASEELAEYPDTLDFVSVKHPIDYMYPGIYNPNDAADTKATLPIPRDGLPVVRLGLHRDIKKDDYIDKIRPDNPVVVKESYIRPFAGFDDTALLTLDDIFSKLPVLLANCLTVLARSESVFVPSTKQIMHFSRITELPMEEMGIIHVYDRNYILRASDNVLWEVRI